jgi:hypothetical protein
VKKHTQKCDKVVLRRVLVWMTVELVLVNCVYAVVREKILMCTGVVCLRMFDYIMRVCILFVSEKIVASYCCKRLGGK